jgi:hypothetical protein
LLSNIPGPIIRCARAGGANDLSRESVLFGEQRVHGVGLMPEQKQTKETKRIVKACIHSSGSPRSWATAGRVPLFGRREQSIKATNQAQLWHPDSLRPLYAEFFRNVRRQPDPPLVTVANGPAHAAPASNGVGRHTSNGGAVSLSFVEGWRGSNPVNGFRGLRDRLSFKPKPLPSREGAPGGPDRASGFPFRL